MINDSIKSFKESVSLRNELIQFSNKLKKPESVLLAGSTMFLAEVYKGSNISKVALARTWDYARSVVLDEIKTNPEKDTDVDRLFMDMEAVIGRAGRSSLELEATKRTLEYVLFRLGLLKTARVKSLLINLDSLLDEVKKGEKNGHSKKN